MDTRLTFQSLAATAQRERERLAAVPAEPLARGRARLALEEIRASARLAGAHLELSEVTALVERGLALGDRPLAAYVVTADYAAAARYVAAAPLLGRKHPYLRVDEIVELHTRATRHTLEAGAGRWRTTTLAAFPGGMMAPAPWLVSLEIAAFVNRIQQGPPSDASPLLWVAEAHERFERIHPFVAGNGRVGRLVVNLLLRRCGFPPFAVRDRDVERYIACLRRADSQDIWPLAAMIARAVLASLQRLSAYTASDDLCNFAALASGPERDALYKAAQRGRLQTVRRGGALLTTQAWIDAYRASRSSRPRDPRFPRS
ncbi:MAG: hypothetical protein NVSMB19_10520 [Vulcanimicrobiaceae bacterium]